MADVSVSHEALSEYEKLRQANIERNEQFLKSLGVSHPVSDHTTHTTNTRHSHSHSHSHSQTRQTKSAAKKRKSDDKSFEEVPPVESRRRSRRIQQLSAEFEESKDEEGIYFIEEVPHRVSTIPVQPLELTVDDAESGRVAVTAAQIQALIEKSDQNHDDLISNELIVHTAYRMSYMSNQALGTRLKSIAKAARASSYEKLLVFYYALVAANLPQLATSAREILEKIGVMTATER